MPYFDESAVIDLQIRDRLRDLLEADEAVQAVYPRPVRRLQTNTVPKSEGSRVALVLSEEDLAIAASQTHSRNPAFIMVVQQFSSTTKNGTDEEEDALDACVTITNTCQAALLRYQSDPTDGVTPRLWDALAFEQKTTRYDADPAGFFYSLTYFTLSSYQRNT